MNKLSKIALAGLFAGSAVFAAPGLTVSGTDLMYKDKKIFFSGTNLAWADYNSDVGDAPLNENEWRKAVEGTRAAGGNAIRWWLFNNMSQSPKIDPTTHLISGIKENTVQNMKKALDIAEEYGVMVSMCLFSHNLMEPNQWGLYTGDKVDITANKLLFEDAGTVAFINKALAPVIRTLGDHPALMSWEIFNEPEGMTSECSGWTAEKMALEKIQKFTNKVAAAIHKVNKDFLVSTGSVNIKYQKYWNDAALIAAGGEETGTLDFFQTHYYPYYQGDEVSPFVNTAAAMQAKYGYDAKPMIIGEFPASGWSGTETYTASMEAETQISTEDAYKKAYEGGYAGALAWQYIGDKTEANFGDYSYTIEPALDAMKKLAATAANDYIKIKDVTIAEGSGDGKMAVTFGGDDGQIEKQNKGGWDLSGASSFTFTAKNNGSTEADIYLIFKMTDEWTWTETTGSCKIAARDKKTCSFDISSFADRNKTVSVVLANYAKGYKGTVVFDDFKAGDKVLFDFNEDLYDVFGLGYGMTEAIIPEIKGTYDENYIGSGKAAEKLVIDYTPIVDEVPLPSSNSNANSSSSTVIASSNSNVAASSNSSENPLTIAASAFAAKLNVQGSTLMLSTIKSGDVSVDVFSTIGQKVATLHRGSLSAGTHAFSMEKLSKGQYIVRIKGIGITSTQPIVIK